MNDVLINTNNLSQWLKEKYFYRRDYYSIDELISIIEDLDADVERLKEEFEDFKKYVESNYKELSYAEQVD